MQHYLILCSLAPAVFFTFAGNILWTYALPALPPLALLGAQWLTRQADLPRVNRLLTLGLILSTVLFAGFVASLNLKQTEDWHTTQRLVAHYDTLNTQQRALIFFPERPYSAAFYSRGRAEQITQASKLLTRLAEQPAYLAVETTAVARLPAAVRDHLQAQGQHGDYALFLITDLSVRDQAID